MKTLAVAFALLVLPAFAQEEGGKALSEKEVKKLQKIVEETRGLEFKKAVKVQVQDEKDLGKNVRKMFDEEFPPEKADRVEAAYKKFGLIPQDLDLREFMVELLTESIGGYYDPKTKQLFLIRREGGDDNPMNRMMKAMFGVDWDTMATIHELTHALQDQHYDLSTIPTDMEGNDDLVTAMQCLFEGEANWVMYDHVMSKRGMGLRQQKNLRMLTAGGGVGGTPKMNSAPEVLKRGLAFPYMEGMLFVHDVLLTGEAWETVEKMYADLPLSTEQVLHPEKYLERDWPQVVTLPDLAPVLGKGWEKLDENALGELNVQVLIGEFRSRKKYAKTIAKAAAGWDGDRYAVYRKGGDVALAWYSAWDTEDDASEFYAQGLKVLAKKLGGAGEADGELLSRWEGGSLLERRGTEVLWIETAGRTAEKVRAAVWEGVKKKELKRVERKAAELPVEEREAPLAKNDLFQLRAAPKGVSWKAVEDGRKVTVTWKGLDGEVTFHPVSAARGVEETLEDLVIATKEELAEAEDAELEAAASPARLVSGRSRELGDVRVALAVLKAKGRHVVARLACAEKDYEKAKKQFDRLVKGYQAAE